MLKKFSVTNYRQFNEKIEFDLTASNYAFNNICVSNGIVRLGLIYGINGSGKSTLGWAIFDLVSHLTDNKSNGNTEHYLNANSTEKYATFEFELLITIKKKIFKVFYKYQKDANRVLMNEVFKIDDEIIIDYNLGQPFFSQLPDTESLNKNINPNQNLSALKYIYSNTSLDKRKTNCKVFLEFINFVQNMLWFRSVFEGWDYIGYRFGNSKIEKKILQKHNGLKDFEIFLNSFGLDFQLTKITNNGNPTIGIKFDKKIIPFFEIVSTGTRTLTLFYHWWIEVKDNNIPLLFIDEFDCSYHFSLSQEIVQKLKELTGTQVILTTHNTDLLSNEFIRPDCGYIIDGKKIRALNHLTRKELREAHNLEKLYHAGHFNE